MEFSKFKNQFGGQAEIYSKFRKPYPVELYDLFFSLLPTGEKSILDLACGPGNSTQPLIREGVNVFGCDIDPLMVEQAQKEAKTKALDIQFTVGEAEHLPYTNNTFDAVTSGAAFHWFVNEAAIKEIKRVLKPGGLLFVYWAMNMNDVRKEDEHVLDVFRSYSWPIIPQEFRDAGYISSFFKEQGLQNVATSKIQLTYNETLEERVNLEKTNAGYGALSSADKEKFLESLTAALKTTLGDRNTFEVKEELQICYGFKA